MQAPMFINKQAASTRCGVNVPYTARLLLILCLRWGKTQPRNAWRRSLPVETFFRRLYMQTYRPFNKGEYYHRNDLSLECNIYRAIVHAIDCSEAVRCRIDNISMMIHPHDTLTTVLDRYNRYAPKNTTILAQFASS